MKKAVFILFIIFLFLPASIFASVGVGVGTGKIQVDEKLKPGIIYKLPPLTVINTGTEPSDYEVVVSYNEKQPQLKPPNDWFVFSPQRFHLDPGKVQQVDIKLNLPLAVTPGNYFGYLEAHPVKVDKAGVTSINIAAAAKLYFTVIPANVFQAFYYKIISFWQVYSPWPQRVLVFIVLVAIIAFIRKFFHIQINLKKPEESNSGSHLSQREYFPHRENKHHSIIEHDKEKNE